MCKQISPQIPGQAQSDNYELLSKTPKSHLRVGGDLEFHQDSIFLSIICDGNDSNGIENKYLNIEWSR